jgi:hypothetical protein
MGRAKDQMMQEDEQGWTFTHKRVCARCMKEPYLKAFIKSSATADHPCSFCKRRPTAALDDVMEIIGHTVDEYYNRAVNEAPYETAEGGYQGTTYGTWEVMESILSGISDRDDVVQAVTGAFSDDIWVERDMFSLNGVQKYVASWDEFCDAVKYKTRYFFHTEFDGELHDTIPVPFMLDWLRDAVQQSNMIRSLPIGTLVYRVRAHRKDEVCVTWDTLGSPPREYALSNRMSAAGISVFYGAFDMKTAVVEASVSAPPDRILTGGAWRNSRALQILDLSALPSVPSLFQTSRDERGAIMFLAEFVSSITVPVHHDGREHIDYVPTQILTEYFRKLVKGPDGVGLDGIAYPSARRTGGRSIVVFAANDELDPEQTWGDEPLLALVRDSIKRQPRPQ